MKKLLFAAVFSLMISFVNAQIKVTSTGKVGINNTSPTYQLDVNGDFRAGDLISQYGMLYSTYGYSRLGDYSYMWDELYAYQGYFYYCDIYYSDASLKTDVRNLSPASERLKGLRPVSYKMKAPEKTGVEGTEKADVEQMGFIAQEMQALFPEIVVADKNGTLGIRYTELIPVLVKAFQEQQQLIDDLTRRIEALETAKK